jgi:hypothetical protein
LRHAGVPLALVLAAAVAERQARALVGRLGLEALRPARADEEDVPDFDVAALRGRADVDALGFAARCEFGVGYAVGVCGSVSWVE